MIISSFVYIFCIIIYLYGMKNNRRKCAEICIIAVFFVLAFSHKPLASDDLTREFEKLAQLKKFGWQYFNSNYSFQEGTVAGRITSNGFQGLYVTQVIYYIFSRIPVFNLLPAVVTGVQFYLQFKILNKIRKRFNLSFRQEILVFLSILLVRELRWMMSGIRNQLAFTIGMYIVYKDFEDKSNTILCIIGYVLCGMIHQSAYIIVALRLLVCIPSKKIKYAISVFLLFWSYLLEGITKLLMNFTNIPMVNSILWKIIMYTDNADSNINVVLRKYYSIAKISDIGILLASIVFLIILIKNKKYGADNKRKSLVMPRSFSVIRVGCRNDMNLELSYDFIIFMLFVTCLTLGSFMYYWVFLRFAILVQIGLPVVSAAAFLGSEKNRTQQLIKYLLIAAIGLKICIMILVVNSSFYFNPLNIYS